MLDCSQRSDLALHAQVLADVHVAAAVLDVRPLIVGAFARDLLLAYAHGIPIGRQTEDLDLGLAVGTWDDFEQLRRAMLASGRFAPTTVAHRLRRGALLVDLVPFGAIETAQRTLTWPPDGVVVMDVFGFQEALRAAIDVRLPGDVATRVVPLPGLALLKLMCWKDRHQRQPRKDAADLQLILGNYLHAGNAARLWTEFVAWTQDEGFDYDAAGARMLGRDIGRLVDAVGRERLAALLAKQTSEDSPGRLPVEMDIRDPERAIRLLAEMRRGILEALALVAPRPSEPRGCRPAPRTRIAAHLDR